VKIPNSKHQAPEKFQASNPRSGSHMSSPCEIGPRRSVRKHNESILGGAWSLALLWSLELGVWCFSIAATISADLEEIPPLRPPRAEIPPTFWEQHGVWVVVGCVALLAIACAAVWRLRRPRPPIVVPPEVLARQALEQLRQRPEDGVLLSWVSQLLRHYITSAFGLMPGELTPTAFCELIEGDEKVGPELAAAITSFLRACDERKFAPSASAPALAAASQALELIDRAEARRAELLEAAAARVAGEIAHSGPVK
jgi:uncharacterized protein DUF4381